MTGSSVFDYVHQADHQEVAEQLGMGLAPQGQGQGIASPGSAGSEEGLGGAGTMNPDGERRGIAESLTRFPNAICESTHLLGITKRKSLLRST